MKGRFRNACIRDASRAGRRESVKLAEARRASLSNGGRPCLDWYTVSLSLDIDLRDMRGALE